MHTQLAACPRVVSQVDATEAPQWGCWRDRARVHLLSVLPPSVIAARSPCRALAPFTCPDCIASSQKSQIPCPAAWHVTQALKRCGEQKGTGLQGVVEGVG